MVKCRRLQSLKRHLFFLENFGDFLRDNEISAVLRSGPHFQFSLCKPRNKATALAVSLACVIRPHNFQNASVLVTLGKTCMLLEKIASNQLHDQLPWGIILMLSRKELQWFVVRCQPFTRLHQVNLPLEALGVLRVGWIRVTLDQEDNPNTDPQSSQFLICERAWVTWLQGWTFRRRSDPLTPAQVKRANKSWWHEKLPVTQVPKIWRLWQALREHSKWNVLFPLWHSDMQFPVSETSKMAGVWWVVKVHVIYQIAISMKMDNSNEVFSLSLAR